MVVSVGVTRSLVGDTDLVGGADFIVTLIKLVVRELMGPLSVEFLVEEVDDSEPK